MRNLYRTLRWLRIVVSLVILSVVTAALSWSVQLCTPLYDWIDSVQFVPAAVRFSMVTFVMWLLVTLMFGRVYCSTVCPLGTMQDIVAAVARMARPRSRRKVYRYSAPRTKWRYGMLVLMLACLLVGFWLAVGLLDPYELYVRFCTDTFAPAGRAVADAAVGAGIARGPFVPVLLTTLAATVLSALLLAAVVAVSARSGRSICNTVCPVGTTLGLVSRYAVWQMDIDTDLCTQCRRCEDVCKASCIDLTSHVVDGSRCVMCMDCVAACGDSAINYTWRRKQLSDPMMRRVTEPGASAPVMEHGIGDCMKQEKNSDK